MYLCKMKLQDNTLKINLTDKKIILLKNIYIELEIEASKGNRINEY